MMEQKVLRYDILKELFNISVGKAAGMLSEILNRRIHLQVPKMEVINKDMHQIMLDQYLSDKFDGTLMVSSITFNSRLKGKANLIFRADKMKEFIGLCSEQETGDEYFTMNFTDLDFDIMKEIGNIVLNSVIGEVGNYLVIQLEYTVPEVKIYNNFDFGKDLMSTGCVHALLLHITFLVDDTKIEGAIIIDLTVQSLDELISRVEWIEETLYE